MTTPSHPTPSVQGEMRFAYTYRLLPTKAQHRALATTLESQRLLYNAALEERISAWRKARIGINFYAQCKSLTVCRQHLPEMAADLRQTQEATLKRLSEAFEAFFRRVKKGEKPGFPRFKSQKGWRSFVVRQSKGFSIKRNRVSIKGLGSLRFHAHRPLQSAKEITFASVRRDPKGWTISFIVHDTPAALSNGQVISNPRPAKRAEKEMRRRQRALVRCKRGSKNRSKAKVRLSRLHQKIVNSRTTYLHQVSARLARNYQTIVVENLNVAGMVKGNLAHSIHDASWSTLKFMLRYKAEKAGGQLIEVNPKYTSQDCSGCGERVPKALSVREHSCPSCGLVLDRDVNAARNILHKAKSGLEVGNVAQWSERRPMNIGGLS